MEDIEIETASNQVEDDFGMSILSRLGDSDEPDHQHICTILGTMSQEIRDQRLPPNPVAYFGATCSSLCILSTEGESPTHVVDALLTILSMVITKVPAATLLKRREYLSEILVRVISSKALSASAAACGCKCISHILTASDKVSWSDLSNLYGILLGFLTDSHPKIRRRAHMCIKDILQNFHGTLMLAPASEGVTKIFERFLLLAGGSNEAASGGPKGAQEVLYLLDALRECLPFMPMRYNTSTLKYFKTLLELRQPIVTRRIKDNLNSLCVYQSSEFPPEMLLDLLCFLALSVTVNETSASDMTSTARLLDVGMKKVFLLQREICVVKLPLVFNALKDVLASEHAEAVFAAMEALKSLTHSCIDDELIKQGVNQMISSLNLDARRSGPTIIEKLCACVTGLLDYPFSAVWDSSFQVVAALFEKLGEDSSHLLRETLKSLADMQKLPDEDFPYRKQLHECVGNALGAMGPESFLSILPFQLSAEDAWLFPLMKQYTVGARLSFFQESILQMVGPIRQKSKALESEGRIFESRSTEALVYYLWSLFPSFCDYPKDTAECFSKLKKALCSALLEEPDVVGIVCSGIQILIRQNKTSSDGVDLSDVEVPRRRALASYTPEFVAQNLRVLKASASEILPVLSRLFLKSTNDAGGCLQATIRDFASIADKAVISRFFRSTLQKLHDVLEAVNADNSRNPSSIQIERSSNEESLSLARAQLIDLAASLLPGLDAKEIETLFYAIKPALKDANGLIQKKAYKVLSMILKNCDSFLSKKLDQLLELMIDLLPSCHFSARRHRLDCLYVLIVNISKDESKQRQCNIISSFLTEIVLALKEANKKTRNRAYDLLVQIGHACGDEEKGGKMENLHQYFYMVAGGLAGDTPHMISAAVRGLARLAYEFTDLVSAAYNVLPSAFLLLQRKNQEIVKANLGLLKVLVVNSTAEGLQGHLKGMVEGLMNWQDHAKNHFRAKVKVLLGMLVKKCGLEAVQAVMPEEHMKLLTNIRKAITRRERKSTAGSREARSVRTRATTSRLSRWNHTKVFSDFGDEDGDEEHMGAKTMSSLRSAGASKMKSKASFRPKSLPEDFLDHPEDEPLDLLDRQRTRSSLRAPSEHLHKRKPESNDELEIDSDGRLVIREGEEPNKPRRRGDDSLDPGAADSRSQASANSAALKRCLKRQKSTASEFGGRGYAGSVYGSKKAGGDVKKKGMVEPYAYWPLDRKMMSRRGEHRAAARKGMTSVVKLTKKLEGRSSDAALAVHGGLMKKRNKKRRSKGSR